MSTISTISLIIRRDISICFNMFSSYFKFYWMLTVLSVDPESQIFRYWGQWKIFFPMQNIKDIYSFIDMIAYLLLPQDKMNELPNWNLIYKKIIILKVYEYAYCRNWNMIFFNACMFSWVSLKLF